MLLNLCRGVNGTLGYVEKIAWRELAALLNSKHLDALMGGGLLLVTREILRRPRAFGDTYEMHILQDALAVVVLVSAGGLDDVDEPEQTQLKQFCLTLDEVLKDHLEIFSATSQAQVSPPDSPEAAPRSQGHHLELGYGLVDPKGALALREFAGAALVAGGLCKDTNGTFRRGLAHLVQLLSPRPEWNGYLGATQFDTIEAASYAFLSDMFPAFERMLREAGLASLIRSYVGQEQTFGIGIDEHILVEVCSLLDQDCIDQDIVAKLVKNLWQPRLCVQTGFMLQNFSDRSEGTAALQPHLPELLNVIRSLRAGDPLLESTLAVIFNMSLLGGELALSTMRDCGVPELLTRFLQGPERDHTALLTVANLVGHVENHPLLETAVELIPDIVFMFAKV